MRVVSDTSTLCYLILIEETQVLPGLFTEIVIPPAVRDELAHPDAPVMVRDWIAGPPVWLSIGDVPTGSDDREIQRLDPGEREAILMAEQINSDLLLLDDWKARELARDRGLPFTGLIGVLGMAIEKGLVEAGIAVERLRATSFRISDQLLSTLLRRQNPD
jgi:predicted nucleic acid-binding protein